LNAFNDRIRPTFQSIIVAGKTKEEAEFLLSAEVELTTKAKDAWLDTETAFNVETSKARTDKFKEVLTVRKSIKRKQQANPNMGAMMSSLEWGDCDDYVTPPASPIAVKKVKVEAKAEPVVVKPEPVEDIENDGAKVADKAEVVEGAEGDDLLKYAANVPLPSDSDDDLMED
jgi:hypothetical protein